MPSDNTNGDIVGVCSSACAVDWRKITRGLLVGKYDLLPWLCSVIVTRYIPLHWNKIKSLLSAGIKHLFSLTLWQQRKPFLNFIFIISEYNGYIVSVPCPSLDGSTLGFCAGDEMKASKYNSRGLA